MDLKFKYLLIFISLLLLVQQVSLVFATSTRIFGLKVLHNAGGTYEDAPFYNEVMAGESFDATLRLENRNNLWVQVEMDYERKNTFTMPKDGVVVYDNPGPFTMQAGEVREVDFTLNVPCTLEDGSTENAYYHAIVTDFEGRVDTEDKEGAVGTGTRIAIGVPLVLEVSGIHPSCDQPEVNERVVFYDKDGDGIYEPDEDEKALEFGTLSIYDEDDNLLKSTNLEQSEGVYDVPVGSIQGDEDLYFTVVNDKFDDQDPSILDTDWEGNVYVDRIGSAAARANAFSLNDVTNYDEIVANVDVRSRNTDQQGNFNLNTMSIGPDDKDQIISPSRWDQLVNGTDFKYADLDHDGRIDPDDKDHVISPLYWDFPN